MKTEKEVFIEHYERASGKQVDETTLQYMNWCIDAIKEHSNQFRYIETTCGKRIEFDNQDFFFLRRHALFLRKANGDVLTTGLSGNNKKTCVPVAKMILGIKERCIIHYADGNRLNLKRDNLSVKDHQKAHFGQKISKSNTSGYKGVSFNKRAKKFTSNIYVDKKNKHLGYYETAKEAAIAYNNQALESFGKHAKLNEIK